MKREIYMLMVAAGLLLAVACRKSTPAAPPKSTSDSARLMILLTSPYLPVLDFFLAYTDTFKINKGPLGYPGMRQYVSVPSGIQYFYVYLSGTYAGIAVSQPYDIKPGASYTLMNPTTLDNFGFGRKFVQDDLSLPPDGYARVRVIQGATYGGPLDIIIHDGDTLARGANYNDVTAFLPVKAGGYTFDVRDSQSPYIFKTSLQATLEAGKNYTLLGKTILVADTSRIVVGMDLIENN